MLRKINSNLRRYLKYWKLIKKKPLLILRLILNYFKLLVLRKKILRKVEIALTFDCQCKCEKCSSARMIDDSRKKLGFEQISEIAKSCLALGAIKVNFTGGEPLLADNLFEIIKLFEPKKTMISINTNGLLLTKDMVIKLRDAGVDVLNISIDSPYASEHDEGRGVSGCFDKVIEALKIIKNIKGIRGQVSTVVVKKVLYSERIWRLLELAKKYNAALGITIPAKCGNWSNTEEILISQEDRKKLECLESHPLVIRHTTAAYLRPNCPAGSEQLYITCYGDVTPCPFIQISFGNATIENLKDIWQRLSNFKELSQPKPVCLSGQDIRFIKTYLDPIQHFLNLPISIYDHPALKLEQKIK